MTNDRGSLTLSLAVRRCTPAARVQPGFEGVTDLIYATQSVIVAALERRELHPIAERLLEQVSTFAAKEVGLTRENAERFVMRMRDVLPHDEPTR